METEGNVDIHGQVESARIISRAAAWKFTKALSAKATPWYRERPALKRNFPQDATIKSEGAVVINKFCNAFRNHLRRPGNQVHAFKSDRGPGEGVFHVEAFCVGNEKGVVTKICLVDKNELANREKLKGMELLKKNSA